MPQEKAFANIGFYTEASGAAQGVMEVNGKFKGVYNSFDQQGKRETSTGTVANQAGSAGATADIPGNTLSVYSSANSPCSNWHCSGTGDATALIEDSLIFKNLPTFYNVITVDLTLNWLVRGSSGAAVDANLSGNPDGGGYTSNANFFENKAGSGSKVLSIQVGILQPDPVLNILADIAAVASVNYLNTAGDSSSIDPSIAVLVPPGVTFTSASGGTYSGLPLAAAPEPSTGALFGIGILSLALMARNKSWIRSTTKSF